MAYNIRLEEKNLMVAERMLSRISLILNYCEISYWLEGGTLLGIRREGRLLPWDDDIDVSIMVDQEDKLPLFYRKLKKAGYRVKKRYFKRDDAPFKRGSLRMIKIRERRFFGLIKGAVCLDFFIKYPNNMDCYWEIADKKKSVPKKFYKTLKNITFKGQEYSIPKMTDAYLTYRYGEWKTPIKDWDTANDDKALA